MSIISPFFTSHSLAYSVLRSRDIVWRLLLWVVSSLNVSKCLVQYLVWPTVTSTNTSRSVCMCRAFFPFVGILDRASYPLDTEKRTLNPFHTEEQSWPDLSVVRYGISFWHKESGDMRKRVRDVKGYLKRSVCGNKTWNKKGAIVMSRLEPKNYRTPIVKKDNGGWTRVWETKWPTTTTATSYRSSTSEEVGVCVFMCRVLTGVIWVCVDEKKEKFMVLRDCWCGIARWPKGKEGGSVGRKRGWRCWLW